MTLKGGASHRKLKFGHNRSCDKQDLMFLPGHVTRIETCLNGHVTL